MYRYVITGNGLKALPVHSELGFFEMESLVRAQSKPLHPDSTDTVWRWGIDEFVNPKVRMLDDFINTGPALM